METIWRWPGAKGSIELRGERHPVPDTSGTDGSLSAVRRYEYAWSVCYPTQEPGNRWLRRPELAQPALHVELMFMVDPRWRVIDDAATVHHLAPLRTETEWKKRLADEWNALAPVVGAAAGVAADAAGQPELAPVAKRIAALKATSVPPSDQDESNWFVRSVHHTGAGGVPYTGVEWMLGRDLLDEIGERVTGSLLVHFDRTETGDPYPDLTAARDSAAGAICRAAVRFQHAEEVRLPADSEYLPCAVVPAVAAGAR